MAPQAEKQLTKSTLLELITPNYCTDSPNPFLFPGRISCPAATTIAEILNGLETGMRLILRVHWAVATLLHFCIQTNDLSNTDAIAQPEIESDTIESRLEPQVMMETRNARGGIACQVHLVLNVHYGLQRCQPEASCCACQGSHALQS